MAYTLLNPWRVCVICGKQVFRGKYCGLECRRVKQAQIKEKAGIRSRWAVHSSGVTGALSELAVCVDLLEKGWEVFRNVAPVGPADIIARKNGQVIDIDVTTGKESNAGKIYHLKKPKCTVTAVVLPNRVMYIPDLPTDVNR